MLDFFLFPHTEGITRKTLAADLFRVERIAHFAAGDTIGTGIVSSQFGVELGAVDFILPFSSFLVISLMLVTDLKVAEQINLSNERK